MRECKFDPGEVLWVWWGIIKITGIYVDNGLRTSFYTFSHLTGDTKGRTKDTRCLATVEDLLKARRLNRVEKLLYVRTT